MADVDWVVVGPMIAKLLAEFIAAEKSRSGLTTEEIFERAGAKLADNEIRLLEDLARLQNDNE